MNGALLITGDLGVIGHIRELAARAGAHVNVQTAMSPEMAGQAPPLTLIGIDRLAVTDELAVPPGGEVIIVSAGAPDNILTAAARKVDVLNLPRDQGDLLLRFEDTAAVVLDRLHHAGYRFGLTDSRHRRSGYVPPTAVTDWRQSLGQAVYVNCGQVACGDGVAGFASAVQRSNFRVLHRRFPDVWTDTVATDVTELGAFVADLPPEAVDALCSLAEFDAVLDIDDRQALHREDIVDSWGLAAIDLYSQLRPRYRQVWDRTEPRRVTELLWEVVTAAGVGPVHDGRRVRWPITELAPLFAARLMAEQRRSRPGTRNRIAAHATRYRYARARRPGR
ncbi:hypothetical protein [Actinoplanes flavus]|uniref:Uncharacterized protein n=1 Tax=Actinoplanes flavus TaxID=2820290 RepID=A0ABS3UG51_9ACTN|nr:hypothetical protein [Actinoplanes flavus]MBO3736667.1 hypothetical protein [Actinoplanes flavus]